MPASNTASAPVIPLVDLKRQYKTIQKDIRLAIQSVIDRADFVLGQDLQLFEQEFASYCGVKHVIGCDSGTGALELALEAMGIGAGDEVIVPAFTFYATASAVCTVGARPVFADVEDDTGNMDPAKLEGLITSKTKAIVPVHLFGQPANLTEIFKVAQKHNLPVLEDSAQAHGGKIQQADGSWKNAGSLGIMGCFSFYPGKNLGAYGDGGAITTNDSKLHEKLLLLRDYGRTGKYQHDFLGYNKRLDTLQAAILRVKLKHLDSWNEARRQKAKLYDELFAKLGIRTFKIQPFVQTVRHVYPIRVPQRDQLFDFLKENGVSSGVHYPIPLHLQKAFAEFGYKKGSLPVCEKMSEEIISLPMFAELKDLEIRQVASQIKRFFKK